MPNFELVPELRWSDRARCTGIDAELFFPEPGADPSPAKAVCAECEVREECLAWALAHGERYGVWGGLTASERRRLGIRPTIRRPRRAAPRRLRLVG